MGARTSGTKSGKSGQKRRPDLLVRSRLILSLIGYGYSANDVLKALQREWTISKQLLSEDCKRMVRLGWIVDENPDLNKWKYYHLTDSGRTVLAGYEKHDHARMTKIENYRHRSTVQNETHLREFLQHQPYHFKRKNLKNQETLYGKINGIAIQVSIGKKVTLIMTPRPMYTANARKGTIVKQQSLLELAVMLNKMWLLNLTPPEPLENMGQIALTGRLPKKVLELTKGAQVRIEKDYGTVVIDQSPPDDYPHIEIPATVPEVVDDLLDTGNHYREILKRLEGMDKTNSVRDNVIERMATVIEKNSGAIDRLADLISGQVKTGPEQVRSLNSLSSNMFQ